MKPKVFAIFSALILAVGVAAGVGMYYSNILSGKINVGPAPVPPPPGLNLSISGLEGNWTVNETGVLRITLTTTIPGNVSITTYLNFSATGITPASVSLWMGICVHLDCEVVWAGAVVNATQVTPNEISFAIQKTIPDPGGWGVSVTFPMVLEFNVQAACSWTAQAVGTEVS